MDLREGFGFSTIKCSASEIPWLSGSSTRRLHPRRSRYRWDQMLTPVPITAAFERHRGASVITKGDVGGAIDAARAVRSDHDTDFAVNTPAGTPRFRELAAGGGGALDRVVIEYRHALFVGQANGIVGRR